MKAASLPLAAPVPSTDAGAGVSRREEEADAQRSSEEVFAGLAREYYGRIFQFLVHQLRNRQDAEDLTQRVFLRAFRGFGRFDRSRPFGPWIFTIARREMADHFRRNRSSTFELEENHAIEEHSPGRAALCNDDAERVWELAKQLPGKQQPVLFLHYAEGFSLLETARILGITHVHAKVLAFRARNRLRAIWEKEQKQEVRDEE